MSLATQDQQLLEAAQDGDEAAFRSLVERHRPELHAHCYRMLGSVHDAEDALQDALLRAWRGLPRFEARSSLRSWLYRIATNTTLDVIARRPKRVLPVDYGPHADPHDSLEPPDQPLVETVWMEPYPDEKVGLEDGYAAPEARYEQREGVELAFVAALQHLPPNQRAALILREVLGFSAREVAEQLDTTTVSVNSALQRARAMVEERVPEQSQQATLRALGDEQLSELVERYSEALEQGDVDALLALLTDDATWSMPPLPNWYRGREAITGFLHKGPFTVRWRHLPAHANGQQAVGCYTWDEDRGVYTAFALDVLRLRGEKIAEVNAFLDGSIFERFGLPSELPAQARPARSDG
ncbi:MAG TPA: sigma-70 family RNA polymerase sigma factor [Solirubrobacterales bacterium]|nr:sigma-70 family RNA polymerase sigma factor [Solirubrobacterales bacterium]